MKRQVLFIQGAGEHVHDEWDDKLVDSLRTELGTDYEVRYPQMPNEGDPSYAAWTAAIGKELSGLADGAIVVGHSIGGAILINTLAEHPPKQQLAAIILISAPFVGDGGWQSDWKLQRRLAEKLPKGVPVQLYYGLADTTVPGSHAELYAQAIPRAHLERLPDRDHQLNNDLREVAAMIRSLAE
jgi:pimeloyl-ACP methyl ester carboxylesterase